MGTRGRAGAWAGMIGEPLFEAELEYDAAQEPVVAADGRNGDLVGSGSGVIEGERVRGTIRWSFYAGDCAYADLLAGVDPGPGRHLCTADPGGKIETHDGATIRFDARGYGLRGYDPDRPHLWRLTMGVRFATTDERYSWLDSALGLLVSEFDETTGRAAWCVHLPA